MGMARAITFFSQQTPRLAIHFIQFGKNSLFHQK